MTEPNLAEVLRKLAGEGDHMATHVDGCWEWHPRCAMVLAADRLEAAEALIEQSIRGDDAAAYERAYGAWTSSEGVPDKGPHGG